MRAVDCDAGFGELYDGGLLGVFVCDGLEAGEDEGIWAVSCMFISYVLNKGLTVADNDADALLDGIDSHLIRNVVSDKNEGLAILALRVRVVDE